MNESCKEIGSMQKHGFSGKSLLMSKFMYVFIYERIHIYYAAKDTPGWDLPIVVVNQIQNKSHHFSFHCPIEDVCTLVYLQHTCFVIIKMPQNYKSQTKADNNPISHLKQIIQPHEEANGY